MTSLRSALLLPILGGLFAVLVISGLAVFLIARSALRSQLDESLADRAGSFASLVVEERIEPEDPDDVGGLVFDYKGPLAESDLGVRLRITDEDGEVIVRSPDWPAELAEPITDPEGDGGRAFASLRLQSGAPVRVAAIVRFAQKEPIDSADPQPPLVRSDQAIVVEVVGRTDAVARAESAVLGALVVGGLLAAAGTGAAVWLGIRRGLVPIHRLSADLDGMDPRELARPDPDEPCPVELTPIVGALDRLLARLRSAIDRERRFTDAAAHELRTPIAEIKTLADVAERWPEPERLRRSISEAGAAANEMEALLECLLAAARGGSAYQSQPAEPIPLLALARTLAHADGGRPRDHHVTWSFEGDDRVSWTAPKGAVLAIVRNLIDNAAEYTPAGGAVRVAAIANGHGSRLEVENGPVSLRPAQVDQIFEPFWRADEARSDRQHRGMGLAIVASLADSLNLQRAASLTPQGGLRITLSAPEPTID